MSTKNTLMNHSTLANQDKSSRPQFDNVQAAGATVSEADLLARDAAREAEMNAARAVVDDIRKRYDLPHYDEILTPPDTWGQNRAEGEAKEDLFYLQRRKGKGGPSAVIAAAQLLRLLQ